MKKWAAVVAAAQVDKDEVRTKSLQGQSEIKS